MANETRPLRLTSAGGINYALMEGFPTYNITKEDSTGVEGLLIRAEDINAFALECIPPPTVIGNLIIRPAGRKMPGTVLVAESVSFKPHSDSQPMDPFGTDSGAPDGTYEIYAVATVNYKSSIESNDDPDPEDPITFLTHTVNVGGQIMSMPPQGTKLDGEANRDQNVPLVKTIPTIEHGLKWDFVLNPKWATILDLIGKVNSSTVTFADGLTADDECLLFTGVSGSKKYLWDGFQTSSDPWELDYKFSHRYITDSNVTNGPAGWNHVFNPKAGKWQVVTMADGSKMYDSGNLSGLFS